MKAPRLHQYTALWSGCLSITLTLPGHDCTSIPSPSCSENVGANLSEKKDNTLPLIYGDQTGRHKILISWPTNCPGIISVLLITPFPSLSLKNKVFAWKSVLRWCFQMNFSVNMIGKLLGKADINTPVGTRTWKIPPPCTISGCTVYKASSHSPSYLGLTSVPWDKQHFTGEENWIWCTATATLNVNHALLIEPWFTFFSQRKNSKSDTDKASCQKTSETSPHHVGNFYVSYEFWLVTLTHP